MNSSQLFEDFPTRGHQLSLDQHNFCIFGNECINEILFLYWKSFIIRNQIGNQIKGKSEVYLCPNKTAIHDPGVSDGGGTQISTMLSWSYLMGEVAKMKLKENYELPSQS